MELTRTLLVAATLLSSLTAGLLFAFAVLVMPGIRGLDDRAFVRAFQLMDRIVQDNHPLFILVWVGSVLTLAGALVVGVGRLEGLALVLLILAAVLYYIGTQLPTFTINIPLNNAIQKVDVESGSAETARAARQAFETRWTRWNAIRTAFAVLASAVLTVLLTLL